MDILQDLEYEQPVSGMEEAISEHSTDVPVGSLSRYVPWHRLSLCPSFPHLPRQQAPLLLEVPCMYPLSAPLSKGRRHGLFSFAVVRGARGLLLMTLQRYPSHSQPGGVGSVMDTIYLFPKQAFSFSIYWMAGCSFSPLPKSGPVCPLSHRHCSGLYLLFFHPWNRIIHIFTWHWSFQWHLKRWKSPSWNGKFQLSFLSRYLMTNKS